MCLWHPESHTFVSPSSFFRDLPQFLKVLSLLPFLIASASSCFKSTVRTFCISFSSTTASNIILPYTFPLFSSLAPFSVPLSLSGWWILNDPKWSLMRLHYCEIIIPKLCLVSREFRGSNSPCVALPGWILFRNIQRDFKSCKINGSLARYITRASNAKGHKNLFYAIYAYTHTYTLERNKNLH